MTLDQLKKELGARFEDYNERGTAARDAHARRTAGSEYWQGKANGVLEALQLVEELEA